MELPGRRRRSNRRSQKMLLFKKVSKLYSKVLLNHVIFVCLKVRSWHKVKFKPRCVIIFDSPCGNLLCHHLTVMGSQSKLDSINSVVTCMLVSRCSVTGDIMCLQLISTLTLKVENISSLVTLKKRKKICICIFHLLQNQHIFFICKSFKVSLLILDVWLFLQLKVNILHIKNQKKDVFSPFLTICLCCICTVSTCHQPCHLYDSVFYSLCSKVSCQVGIELATLRGAGMGQLSLPSFIKKRNSISISFAALIKGIVTVSYI